MQISDILLPDGVRCSIPAASKKRALEMVSELLIGDASTGISHHAVFDCLLARERLGSTSLGNGVALPHARMTGVDKAVGVFVRLAESVDFDAPDGTPVDLLFGLLVPEESTEEHLQVLAALAKAFSDPELRNRIRDCVSEACIYEQLTQNASIVV